MAHPVPLADGPDGSASVSDEQRLRDVGNDSTDCDHIKVEGARSEELGKLAGPEFFVSVDVQQTVENVVIRKRIVQPVLASRGELPRSGLDILPSVAGHEARHAGEGFLAVHVCVAVCIHTCIVS